MLNLYEYQSKKLFSKFELPILKNWVFFDVSEIEPHLPHMIKHGPPWIAKCQIRSGGRGQHGGVKILNVPEDIFLFVNQWIGKSLVTYQTDESGETVKAILIEPAVKILHEFYLSVFIDRNSSQIVCLLSIKGGVNIENIATKSPDLIHKIFIDPEIGAQVHSARVSASKLGLFGTQISQFIKIYINVVNMFLKTDLMLVEINPIVVTEDNNLLCLDAKISMDDNAWFRQSESLNICFKDDKINNSYEITCMQSNKMNFVSLKGNIGCIVNGAGLAMATMDLIKSLGGAPANFLDIGGDSSKDSVISAINLILEKRSVRGIFINIFGGIVCCNLVADAIISVLSKNNVKCVPIVVRFKGNNARLGSNKLINSNLINIFVIDNLIKAVQKTIELVR